MAIDTNGMNSTTQNLINALQNPNEASRVASKKSLGQEDFLKLLTTQMKNQDPTNPVDNTKMIADMANFSSLQAMQDLNKTVGNMAQMLKMTQAIQASVLVGHEVVGKGNLVKLEAGKSPVGLIELESALTDVKAELRDSNGMVVKTFNWNSLSSGMHDLGWDGKDDTGNALPVGNYTLSAWGTNAEGVRASVSTMVANRVVSVDLKTSGALLNLADGSQTSLDRVQQIR
jgi:flagellar basal-body rod modification protein FlgD